MSKTISPNSLVSRTPIAIVGMGCWLPGASDPRQLWENVLARRREFRRMPDVRTPLSDYYDSTRADPDKFYQSKVAVIDGFQFDWAAYRIPESTYIRTDVSQWLALEIAHRALKDAGFTRASVPKERTGVFVGNTCTGEDMRSNTLRLRWPVVKRAMLRAGALHGVDAGSLAPLVQATEDCYKSIFPELTEDFVAGSISATIAGRICNFFDLHGGGFVVDGACASSLATVITAANLLSSGDLDLALAGGVDISLDPFELVGFSRNGALTADDIRPYDRRGDGFLPGEGGGMVVLKRLDDANRDGDEIYAVIRGWGLASDGKAGIMQPIANQQAAAIRRAVDRAGFDLDQLDFIEGHGTGTRAGDRTEIEGLSVAMALGPSVGDNVADRTCGIGSLKSIIGHTKATAGVASLIKAVAAVNRRAVPPTANCEQRNDAFEGLGRRFFPIGLGEIKADDTVMRAGVSAYGFGGINTHLLIESGGAPSVKLAPTVDERALLVSGQETELFVFGASTREGLMTLVDHVTLDAPLLSQGDLVDLAAALSKQLPAQPIARAAVIAGTPDDLVAKLATLREGLLHSFPESGAQWVSARKEVFIAHATRPGRMGFLFPGQGSQQLLMARTLLERYEWARRLAQEAESVVAHLNGKCLLERIYRPIDRAATTAEIDSWAALLSETEVAQPAICLASLLLARYLTTLGIEPVAVGGHSLGEITALQIAGAFAPTKMFEIAAIRGDVMRAMPDRAGTMASLACHRAGAQALLDGIRGTVVVANINSPNQTVVSGDASAIDEVLARASEQNIVTRRLPVSNAFHSPLVAHSAKLFETALELSATAGDLAIPVVSGVAPAALSGQAELRRHLAHQITSPVNFVDLARDLKDRCDALIEVGPGRALTGLCRDIFNEDICTPIAADAQKWNPNQAVAVAYVHGIDIRWSAFYDQRLVRDYKNPSERIFLSNPAERPMTGRGVPESGALQLESLGGDLGLSGPEFAEYLRQRGDFLAGIARLDMAAAWPTSARPVPALPVSPPTARPAAKPQSMRGGVQPKPTAQTMIQLLCELTSERTGYAVASITAESRLLDDLNLDSIKAGELVAAALVRIGAPGELDATRFANASLSEIARALCDVAPLRFEEATSDSPLVAQVTPAASSGTSLEAVLDLLMMLTSQRTGYAPASITAQSRVLDDLNLDSIKSGELVAEALRRIGAAGEMDATRYANASLLEIAQALHAVVPEPVQQPAVVQPNVDRAVVRADLVSEADFIALLVELTHQRTGYERASIAAEARLLDDLNLDSIKAGELVAEALKRVGASGAVDATRFANASLQDIAAALLAVAPRVQAADANTTTAVATRDRLRSAAPVQDDQSFVSRYPTWTRNYVIRAEPRLHMSSAPAASGATGQHLAGAVFLIFADAADQTPAKALLAQIESRGGQGQIDTFDAAARIRLQQDLQFTHHVAVLPRQASEGTPAERLARMISRVTSVGQFPARKSPAAGLTTVAYVQFGEGYFGSDEAIVDPEVANALAYARTLHLERDDLRVRVLDFAASIESDVVAALALDEIGGDDRFAAVGFDNHLTRRVQVASLSEPMTYSPRAVTWSDRDVILVTGGAKGILAECALGIARETGATLVLVGRGEPSSVPGGTGDIDLTIERFKREQLRFQYLPCDIVDAGALVALVKHVEQAVGPITGVIHGASVLRPCRTEGMTVDGTVNEISPKVLGAWNLCRALRGQPLKLFVAFSSLVVDHGMPWSSGYGFANEVMERVMLAYGAVESQMPVQIVSFGLWGKVGRPAELKTNDHLLSVGLHDGEIPPDEGVRRFVETFVRDPGVRRLCIYGRSVGYGPWNQLRAKPNVSTKLRYVERVLHLEPGVELIARCRLTLQQDLYLHDHVYNGMYIVPTVFALEALAQAAYALTPETLPLCRLEGVEMPYPLVVDAGNGIELELRAEVLPSTPTGECRISVCISTEQQGFKTPAVLGTVVFGQRSAGGQMAVDLAPLVPIKPKEDLYGRQFFVGPRYQRMQTIHAVDPDNTRCVGEISSEADAALQAFDVAPGTEPKWLLLGDPFFRDTLLHTSLVHHLEHMAFTSRIDRIELFEGSEATEKSRRQCVAKLGWSQGKDAEFELAATSLSGQVLERWTGFCTKALAKQTNWPSTRDLIDISRTAASDEHALLQQLSSAAEKFGVVLPQLGLDTVFDFSGLSRERRHEHQTLLATRMVRALAPKVSEEGLLTWASNGRPKLQGVGELEVSFSDEGSYCLGAVGPHAQGCDLAGVSARNRSEWQALLGTERLPLLATLRQHDDLDDAGTRVWAALEAARKASNRDEEILTVVKRHGQGVLFRAQSDVGELWVLTLPLRLSRGPRSMLAVVVPAPQRSAATGTHPPANVRIVRDEQLGCDVLEQEFHVSWKECTTPSRKAMSSFFVDWFHRTRELMLPAQTAQQQAEKVADGSAGLVARSIQVKLHGEVTAHDSLCARIWVSELSDTAASWQVEFFKTLSPGSTAHVATVSAHGGVIGSSKAAQRPDRALSPLAEYRRFVPTLQPDARPREKDPTYAFLDKGSTIYVAPAGPRSGPALHEETVRPSLVDSDLVGNVSSQSYFGWLAHVRDLFLHAVVPTHLLRKAGHTADTATLGEAVCLEEEMVYLREAFPFDCIVIELKLIEVAACGARLRYEFYRLGNGAREKLASGQQELVWVRRDKQGRAKIAPLPAALLERLMTGGDLIRDAIDQSLSKVH